MITFQNPGLIDITAMTTFGVSVKESENPIGFFGTGLKYAISIVLRNGGSICVYRGLERLEFTVESTDVRGQSFGLIHMNGKALGFTTHLGANWKPWQAYRELRCNATDEGGSVKPGQISPQEGMTTIQVEGLDDAHATRDESFLNPEIPVTYDLPGLQVIKGAHLPIIYMRGVRVADMQRGSAFTYNVTQRLLLTEDRTLASQHDFNMAVVHAILKSENKEFILTMLRQPTDSFEGRLDFDWASAVPSETFLNVVASLCEHSDVRINNTVLTLFKRYRAARPDYKTIPLNEIQTKQLDRACGFLNRLGYPINASDIRVCRNLGNGVMGLAVMDKGQIYLSEATFGMGTKYVASTALEEWIHLTFKYEDNSREMQNYLFDQLVSMGERFLGEPV